MQRIAFLLFVIRFIVIPLDSVALFLNHSSDKGNCPEIVEKASLMVASEPEQVISMLNDLLNSIATDKEPHIAARAHGLLGDAYYYLQKFELSGFHYQKAVDINLLWNKHISNEQIALLGNLGYVYDMMEQPLIALNYYERALRIARELNNTSEIASNLANMGKILALQGWYEDALANMEEALAIDRAAGDESVVATDLNTIARIYEAWGLYDKAVDYLTQAMEINHRFGEQDKVAIRLNGLGLVYKAWGKYAEALEYFEKALAIDKKLKNDDKVALRQANIGSTYLEMGQIDKAVIFLNLGLEFFKKNVMTSYVASTLIDLGRCYLLLQEYDKAESAFLDAIEYSMPGRFYKTAITGMKNLADLYKIKGYNALAFEYLHHYTVLKDSLFNTESRKKLLEFQARYDLEKKQKENELLKQEQESSQRQKTNIILFSSLIGLFLATVLLVVWGRMKVIQNRKLKMDKENVLLRNELEQRNRELAYNAMCIVKNNETVASILEAVDSGPLDKTGQNHLKSIIDQLQKLENNKSWEEFEVRFVQTHQDFYNKLQTKFPDLTPNERRLCAFLRLNMSTKEIAALTRQSVNSINVARTRLRKKLGIDSSDENLIGFLHSL